jgi:hypothetical protein
MQLCASSVVQPFSQQHPKNNMVPIGDMDVTEMNIMPEEEAVGELYS